MNRLPWIAALLAFSISARARTPEYTAVDLGEAGENRLQMGINNKGQVVGAVPAGSVGECATRFEFDGATVHRTPLSKDDSEAIAINGAEQIAGYAFPNLGGPHGQGAAVFVVKGSAVSHTSIDPARTFEVFQVRDINDAGLIGGYMSTIHGSRAAICQLNGAKPVRTQIRGLPNQESAIQAINNTGLAVGWYYRRVLRKPEPRRSSCRAHTTLPCTSPPAATAST